MSKLLVLPLLSSWCLLFIISCKQTPKPPKSTAKSVDSCNCGIGTLPAPPKPGSLVATDSIFYKADNKSRLFAVSLVASKTVDIEGNYLQLFHIKASNQPVNELYDFALPIKYNQYWNDFHIYKDAQKKRFNIGFVNTDSNFIHLMYAIYLDTLPFNKDQIRFDFKEQKIKLPAN